ncbi:CYTH domain-containing protein [Salinimicrobium catena]|uniref:CYTH domain-containing protein n=1 Tax=Salinimicrobium catena TaxID=390640 RepID=UPI002FE47BD9
MTEIERKFLVPAIQPVMEEAFRQTRILQGYLNSDPDRTVRVRIKGSEAFLTVKGRSSKSGMSRFEWEKEISVPEAEDLLKICEPGAIEKVRYEVKAGEHVFEVDEFFGANEGLLLAEIELSSEEDTFEEPTWLGKEVTGNKMYYNSYLSKFPYKEWQNLHL